LAKGEIMSDIEVQSAAEPTPGLTQLQRFTNAFAAPSKTFEDIKRGNKSWWLPFLLFVLIGTGLWGTVTVKVGWEQVVENSIRISPKQAAQMEKLTPEQKAAQMRIAPIIQEVLWALAPAWIIVMNLIAAGILLGTINFGFGGRATFGKVFAVSWYAGLPGLIKLLLGIAGLWAGMAPESFLPQNPAGTNLGFFFGPPDVPMILWTVYSALDVLTIWTLVLFSIGLAKVAGTKTSTGYIAVFGWWALSLLFGIGMAALQS
jgi:Yip1 domain